MDEQIADLWGSTPGPLADVFEEIALMAVQAEALHKRVHALTDNVIPFPAPNNVVPFNGRRATLVMLEPDPALEQRILDLLNEPRAGARSPLFALDDENDDVEDDDRDPAGELGIL